MSKAPAKSKTPAKASPKAQEHVFPQAERISGPDFTAWQEATGLPNNALDGIVGIHFNSARKYQAEGAPGTVALACAAVAAGLPPYSKATAPLYAKVRAYLRRTARRA